LLVAEYDGPTMFARIGVTPALNRHVEGVRNTPPILTELAALEATAFGNGAAKSYGLSFANTVA
jgi:hypothetical protein